MAKHSKFGFSSASRYWKTACPASVRLTRNIPNQSSHASELGTAAHELGEFCLNFGAQPADCMGMEFNKHIVDQNMIDAVEVYVGFVRQLEVVTGCRAELEKRVVMLSLGREDIYGTADMVLVDLANMRLYIGDYKHGYGVVDVVDNKQLIGYSISTLDTLGIWEQIREVVTTIIQPRASHIEGAVRSHTYTTVELVEWQKQYAETIQIAENPLTQPLAGEHCTYCRRARCRKRWEYVMDVISPEAPDDELTTQEVGYIYTQLDVIKRFTDRIDEEAKLAAKQEGYAPEGYKPVKAIKWSVVEDEEGLINAVEDPEVLYEKKLKSKSKLRGKVPQAILNKFFVAPPSSITLAKITDNRPAVKANNVEGVFTPIKD